MMKQEAWIKTVFRFAGHCKGRMTLAVLFEVLSVGCGLIPYISVYHILMLFFEEAAEFQNTMPLIVLCAAGYFAKILLHAIATTLSHMSAYSILEQIRLAMTQKLMNAPLGTVLSRTGGELKSTIIDRVETIELPLAHIIPEGISNLLVPLAMFAYMLHIDWRLALWSLICVPLAFLVYSFVLRSYNEKYADFMKSSNHVNSVIVEYVEGIEVIKAFGRSGSSYEKYKNAVSAFKEYTLDWFRSTWKHMTLGGAILPSSLLGALPAAIALYLAGEITPAEIVISIVLSMGLVAPLTAFTMVVNDLKSIEYAVCDAREILGLPELPNAEKPVPINNYGIHLENVSFSYHDTADGKWDDADGKEDDADDKGDDVLKNISLSFPEGSYTALVGPSGSGKSTVARLIARYWDVGDGRIKIGDADVRDIPLSQLAKAVSFVIQDNYLFNRSLLENIRMGNPAASDEEVYAAAKAALCDDFIRRLPNGYQTNAGEAGGRLSGGERQRIAIARAILKDSPVIILDEATAFTDPENEDKLQKSIMALTRQGQTGKKKTLIVIAHRLSTIKEADSIVVLNRGEVAAVGKHSELLNASELYRTLWESHIGAKEWSAAKKQGKQYEITGKEAAHYA